MNRAQIIEDLKQHLQDHIDFGDEITPEQVLETIDKLEEEYE